MTTIRRPPDSPLAVFGCGPCMAMADIPPVRPAGHGYYMALVHWAHAPDLETHGFEITESRDNFDAPDAVCPHYEMED
jgi:hypothetical protein